jgi:hypothetical protein
MARSEARIIEVISRVVRHPEPLHHLLGSQVDASGHGDDLIVLQLGEPALIVTHSSTSLSVQGRKIRRGLSMIGAVSARPAPFV